MKITTNYFHVNIFKNEFFPNYGICYCDCRLYMGALLATEKDSIPLWQQSCCWYLGKPPGLHRPWLWSVYCTYVQLTTILMYVLGVWNNIADSVSHFQMVKFKKLAPQANTTPDNIPAWPMHSFTHASCNAVAPSTRCTYQSELNAFVTFCAQFNISPISTSSLTLKYFCADVSWHTYLI